MQRGTAAPSRGSVYLADPDDAFRRRLAGTLRDRGARVVEFSGGAELGRRARSDPPDLILFAGDRGMEGCQVFARIGNARIGDALPLVLVIDRSRAVEAIAESVLGFLSEWGRLYVRNLAGVMGWLQARERSGRLELKAFGERGTIVLHKGEVVEASWKELRGRKVLEFFVKDLPEAGFRFEERLDAAVGALEAGHALVGAGTGGAFAGEGAGRALVEDGAGGPGLIASQRAGPGAPAPAVAPLPGAAAPSGGRGHLDLARALLERRLTGEALVQIRIAEGFPGAAREARLLLAVAHLQSGDLAVAQEELKACQRALPGDLRVEAVLEEARRRSARTLPAPVQPAATQAVAMQAVAMQAVATQEVATQEVATRLPAPAAVAKGEAEVAWDTGQGPAPQATTTHPATPAEAATAWPAAAPEPAAPETPSGRPPTITRAIARARLYEGAPPLALGGSGARGTFGGDSPMDAVWDRPFAEKLPEEGEMPRARQEDRRRWLAGWRWPAAAAVAFLCLSLAAFLRDASRGEATRGRASVQTAGLQASAAAAPPLREATGSASPLEPGPAPASSGSSDRSSTLAAVLPVEAAAAPLVKRATAAVLALGRAFEEAAGPGWRAGWQARAVADSERRPAETVEQLLGRPRLVEADVQPRLHRLPANRSLRHLIDPSTGSILVVPAWRRAFDSERTAAAWVLVDASGAARDARIRRSSGSPELDSEALVAALNATYSPARRAGAPLPAWSSQRVVFQVE